VRREPFGGRPAMTLDEAVRPDEPLPTAGAPGPDTPGERESGMAGPFDPSPQGRMHDH
jgi:hypothetical protein